MSQQFAEILKHIATDKTLQTSHVYIFSKMDKADLTLFKGVWPTIAVKRRQEVVEELIEIGEANFEVDFSPVFLLGLGDEDAEVRAGSINGLWEHEDPLLINPLTHLLQTDEVALVRAAAATALGRFIYLSELEELDTRLVAPVKKLLLDTIQQRGEDIEVRRRAVEAIAFFNGPDITRIIENAYYDENEKMQVSAIFAMGRNADARWRPRVVAELDNESTEIRFEAARSCGELEASEAVPKLINLIESDSDLQVQEVAIWALGRIGGPAARDALEICLESEVESLVLAAEEALEEIDLFSGTLELFDFDEDKVDLNEWDDLDEYGGKYQLN
jgi:HEAT repeat protein